MRRNRTDIPDRVFEKNMKVGISVTLSDTDEGALPSPKLLARARQVCEASALVC